MNWEYLRVAYAPYDKNFSAPGDRRRFIFFANEKKIKYEIASTSKDYDIVYLTYGCDLSAWIKYKYKNPNVKLIFELIDSYLLEKNNTKSILRGIARFILGLESNLWFNYKNALRKILTIADVVVCSSLTQKENILQYNKNTHISLDYFSNDINYYKNSLENHKKFKIVWEGQAYTVNNLLFINDVFEKLGNEFELYIITDYEIKYPINLFSKKTSNLLKSLKCKYYLIKWDKESFSKNIANSDLAIIPIPINNPMMWNKPENKLLLLWEIGIPTLTSPTPAYKSVMDAAGLDLYCSSSDEWVEKIKDYMQSSIEYRELIVKNSNDYLSNFHNKYEVLKNWDRIFASL